MALYYTYTYKIAMVIWLTGQDRCLKANMPFSQGGSLVNFTKIRCCVELSVTIIRVDKCDNFTIALEVWNKCSFEAVLSFLFVLPKIY